MYLLIRPPEPLEATRDTRIILDETESQPF
jgi:hypothetical protein